MRIVTVLRSGGEYLPEHVIRLRNQIAVVNPELEFLCLTDLDQPGCRYRVPLRYNWPGWWSKMEMFSDVHEPFLYMDLDTTIIGPLDEIVAQCELTVLSDFYRPKKIQSSLMLVTPDAAAQAWGVFISNPERHMRECVTRERWGDQGFLESVWGCDIARWQDVVPGMCASWKVNIRKAVYSGKEFGDGTIPDGTSVIVFHGKPRPWELGL